jgi:poly(hydroxyalkanoate) depolymerase family esterase
MRQMTRRSISSIWRKALTRNLHTLARNMGRAGVGAAALKTARLIQPTKGITPPAVPKGPGDWLAGAVAGAAGSRHYRLYRPAHVGPEERLPLLVMLHGCGQDATSFAAGSRMNRLAERHRFMVLYPEQDRLANPQGCWNWFDTRSGRAQNEAALLMKAVSQVIRQQRIDPERIAVAGLSAGAGMAALLATQHPDQFKAVVMHSGVPPGTAHSTLSALSAMRGRRQAQTLASSPTQAEQHSALKWPPLMVIHGTMDAVVAVNNAHAAVRLWSDAADAKASTPRRVQRGKRHPMVVTDYKRGRTAVATLVEIARLGHAWSGGAARQPFSDPSGPDASRLLWAFVAKQFKRAVSPGGTTASEVAEQPPKLREELVRA